MKQKDQALLIQKESIKELKKRIAKLEEKLSQKDTLLERIKNESENCVLSFNQQKQAFIEHINNIEKDLQIFERSVFEKDEQIENVIHEKEILANKSQSEVAKYKRQLLDQNQAYLNLTNELERSQIESTEQSKKLIKHQSDLETKMTKLKSDSDDKLLESNNLNKTKLKESAQKYKDLKDFYESKNSGLEDSLAKLQAELQTQNDVHKNETESKSLTIKELNEICLNLNTDLDSVKQELKINKNEAMALRKEVEANDLEKINQIENLMNTLNEVEQMNTDLKYQLEDKCRRFEEISKENILNSKQVENMRDHIKSLETDKESSITDIQSRFNNTTQELFNCRDLIKSLEQEIGDKSLELDQKIESSNEFASLKALEIENLKTEVLKKDQDMKQLVEKSSDTERLKEQEVKMVSDRLEVKLKEIDILVSRARDMESFKNNSINGLETLVVKKDSEIKRFVDELNSNLFKYQDEKSSFEEQIRGLYTQISLLNTDLKDVHVNNSDLERMVVDLRRNFNESEINLESMKTQLSQTQELLFSRGKEFDQERKELNQTAEKLHHKIDSQHIESEQFVIIMNEQIESQKIELESRTNNFMDEKVKNLKEIETLTKTIKETNSDSKILNEKYTRLNETLNEMEKFNEKDKHKLNGLLHKIQKLENDLENLRMEKESVEQVVRKDVLVKKDLVGVVEGLERELKNREIVLEKSEKDVQSIGKELEKWVATCDELEAKNLEQLEGLSKSHLDIEKNLKELSESRDEVSRLCTRVDELVVLRDQLDQQVSVLSKIVEETSQKSKLKEQEVERLVESLNESRQACAESQKCIESIRLESQTVVEELRTAENEKQMLKENLGMLESKHVARIQELEEDIKVNESKTAEYVADLSTTRQKLEQTSNALVLESRNLERKTADLIELESLAHEKEEDLNGIRKKMQVKDVLLNNNATKINQIEVELSNEKEKFQEIEQKLAQTIKNSQVDKIKHESEIQTLAQTLSDEKLDSLKSSKMLEIQTQKTKDLNEEVLGLKLSIQSSEQLVSKLKVDLNEKAEKVYEKDELIQKLELITKSKNEDFHKLKIELDRLELGSSDLNTKVMDQKAEITLKERELERFKKEYDEIKTRLENNINMLESNLEFRNGVIKNLGSEIRELTNLIVVKEQDFTSRVETMGNENKELNLKLTEACKDLDQSRNEFEKTLELTTKTNEEKVAKLVDLVAVNAEEFNNFKEDQNILIEQMKARFDLENGSLSKKLVKKDEEVQKLSEKFEFLEMEKKNVVDELMEENQNLTNEIADFAAKFDMKTIEFVNLSETLEKKLGGIAESKSRISGLESLIQELEENSREKEVKFSKELKNMQDISLELQSEKEKLVKEIKQVLNERNEVVDEMENIKKVGKFEFHALQQQIIQLNSQIETNSRKYESTVQEFGRQEAEYQSKASILQNELEDKNSIINRSELHLTNEITSRQLVIKSLEQKLREYKKSYDSLETHLDLMKTKFAENEQTNQEIIQSELSKQLAKSNTKFNLEKQNLLDQLTDYEKTIHQVQVENDK
jgi:chromosome segregation ATPase